MSNILNELERGQGGVPLSSRCRRQDGWTRHCSGHDLLYVDSEERHGQHGSPQLHSAPAVGGPALARAERLGKAGQGPTVGGGEAADGGAESRAEPGGAGDAEGREALHHLPRRGTVSDCDSETRRREPWPRKESRRLFGLSRFERHLQCISDPEHEEFQCLWPHSHQGANGESSFTLTLQWHFSQDCAAHCFHARFQELFNNLIVDFEQKSYCQAREYNLKHQSHQQPRCALGSSKLYNTILKASSCSNLLVVTLFFHRESAA